MVLLVVVLFLLRICLAALPATYNVSQRVFLTINEDPSINNPSKDDMIVPVKTKLCIVENLVQFCAPKLKSKYAIPNIHSAR